MPETLNRFDWPIVCETTSYALVGSRVFEPVLNERRLDNVQEWTNRSNWFLGFYFSRSDTRLWVPRQIKYGHPSTHERVINFGHPLGRKALRILILGYGIGLVAILMAVSALVGVRW